MNRFAAVAFTCLALSLFAPSLCAVNLVANGSFESPVVAGSNTTAAAGSNGLTSWTIAGSSGVDLVHTLWQPSDGVQSISLNWTSPSTISQTIATTPGQIYVLSFDMAAEVFGGPSTRSMNVLWDAIPKSSPTFQYTGQGANNMGWQSWALYFVGKAGGSDTLTFASTTIGSYGPTLDNVALYAVVTGLPGDFNSDNSVDAADYVLWRKKKGAAQRLPNDGGLGVPIGQQHYELWRSAFGIPAGSGSGTINNGGAVPEPATVLLAFLAANGLLVTRTRLAPSLDRRVAPVPTAQIPAASLNSSSIRS